MLPRGCCTLLLLLGCAPRANGGGSAGQPTTKLLFHDEDAIAQRAGLTRTVHAADFAEAVTVLLPDAPWERDVGLSWSSVLHDPADGKFKIFYAVNSASCISEACEGQRSVAYAESSDGANFTKPVLGLFKQPWAGANGTAQNNLLGLDLGLDAVWIDPTAPPAERFRAQGKVHATHVQGA